MGGPNPTQLPLFAVARTLVPRDKERDTIHLLLAALLHPEVAGPAGEVFAQLDEMRRNRLQTALSTAINLAGNSVAFGQTDRPSDRLRQCEARWQQTASITATGLTTALVLATIIAYDGISSTILANSGIDPREFLKQLEFKSTFPESAQNPSFNWQPTNTLNGAPPFVPGSPVWPPQQPWGPFPTGAPRPWSWEDQRAQQKALELTKPLEPSRMRIHRDMHPVAANHFLNELHNASATQDVPILVGRRGSPMDKIGLVLADRIGIGERFTVYQENINRYRAVYRLDAPTLLALARVPNEVAPYKVFDFAKQLVQRENAILLIDHIEAWRANTVASASAVSATTLLAAAEALRAQLANRGAALVCATYYATDEADVFAEASLGLGNAKLIRVNSYTDKETSEYLRRFCVDYWASNGYVFNTDAFTSIYQLEPGCWINLQRMTLPYLAVSLAEDTIATAMRGEDAIKETVNQAMEAVKQVMLTEWPTAPDSVKATFQQVLQQAQSDLNGVARSPMPKAQGPHRKMLSRGHIVAQLFCPNESEFHLPGFRPKDV